jgi:hypothetical protein
LGAARLQAVEYQWLGTLQFAIELFIKIILAYFRKSVDKWGFSVFSARLQKSFCVCVGGN